MKERAVKEKRRLSILGAYGTIVFMQVVIGGGNGILGMDLKMMLIVCTVFNTVVAWSCHYTWDDVLGTIVKKITSMGGCFLILMGIGFLVGTFMMSGTLPILVSWLAQLISPNLIIVLSFVLCGILSEAVGSSFAAMGTLGVVMFSEANVQGIPVVPAAGAVICGAWLGQYISPVADVVNCAASCNNISTSDYMKDMVKPLSMAAVLTLIFFAIIGFTTGDSGADSMAGVQTFIADVNRNFNMNPIAILPLVVAIVLSVMKVNTILVLFGSGFLALILGVIIQGFDLVTCISAAYSGFTSAAFLPGVSRIE